MVTKFIYNVEIVMQDTFMMMVAPLNYIIIKQYVRQLCESYRYVPEEKPSLSSASLYLYSRITSTKSTSLPARVSQTLRSFYVSHVTAEAH